MARDRANINTGIWTDDEFIDISRDEQWLYFLLMTDPKLSYAGVTDWRPGRIAQRSGDTSKEEIEHIGARLQAGRYIFIDEDTEEVLIRSFLRHDGLLKQPRLGVSMFNAYGAIASKNIRKVVIHELKRLHHEFPDWKAFGVDKVQELLKLSSADMSEFTQGFTPPLTPGFGPGFTPNESSPQASHTATATSTATSPDGEGSGERRKRELPLPNDWAPTSAHKEYADKNNLDLEMEAERFQLHAQANDRRQRDWNAAFRMWLTKAQPAKETYDPWQM
jgi:hypothetical protein